MGLYPLLMIKMAMAKVGWQKSVRFPANSGQQSDSLPLTSTDLEKSLRW